jgi:pectinesterase
MHFSRFLVVISLASSTLGATTPPAGAIVVSKGGSIQAAVNKAKAGNVVFIQAGEYSETVLIGEAQNGITIMGASDKPDSYKGNTVTISHKKSQKDGVNNDQTGTLRIHANDVKVYNINVRNTYGAGSQALALSTMGDNLGFYGCMFDGYQDTVETEGSGARSLGKQVFAKCLIQGATDFIFGKTAAVWFEGCDLKVKNIDGTGWITGAKYLSTPSQFSLFVNYILLTRLCIIAAQGRESTTMASGYVINNSEVLGGKSSTYYLGRPWRQFARVTFQYTKLPSSIRKEGWGTWVKNGVADDTKDLTYGEYKNTGPGSGTSARVKFGKVLSAPESITNYLGSGYQAWVDMKYMSR